MRFISGKIFTLLNPARAGFLVALLALTGCAESGPRRVHVSGDITWNNKAIPSGFVVFSPDVRKGTRGPQGLAKIKDGKFDTHFEGGRPVTAGALEVTICGYDGVNPSEEHPWGHPLFIDYKTDITVADAPKAEFNLTVPDSIAPVR